MTKIIKRFLKYKKDLKIFFPLLYLVILALGFVLFLVTKVIPAFDLSGCLTLGGQQVCTLVGIYILTVTSLAGYVVLGSLLHVLSIELPVILSYLLVIVTNIVIFYILGSAAQMLIRHKNNPDKYIVYLITYAFLFLLSVYLVLSVS